MPDYSVIDAHIHTYRMAEMGWQAQRGTGRSGYAGTVEEYLDVLAVDGIEKAIMVNMTPVAEMREALMSRGMTEDEASAEAIERLRRRNAWTCAVARSHEQLVPYLSLDPSMGEDGTIAELTARVEEGNAGSSCTRPISASFPATGASGLSTRRLNDWDCPSSRIRASTSTRGCPRTRARAHFRRCSKRFQS